MRSSHFLAGAVAALGCVAWAKAPLVPLYSIHFDKIDALGGIEGRNVNSGSGTVPLLYKLWNSEKCVPARYANNVPELDPVHGYSIQENAWSSFWLVGDTAEGLGCSYQTGFTLSFWVKPQNTPSAWSDFLGFRLGAEDMTFEYTSTAWHVQMYSGTGGSSSVQHLRSLANKDASISTPLKGDEWNHLCLVWKPNIVWQSAPTHYGELWVNGVKVGLVVPSSRMAGPLRELHLGGWERRNGETRSSSSHSALADIEVYGQAISDDDVAWLSRHVRGPIPRGRETTVSLHLEKGASLVSFANSGTLTNRLYTVNGGCSVGVTSPAALGSQAGLYVNKANGEWMDGDETTGLGCSTATGFTLSYWVKPTKNVGAWSDLFSLGLGNGTCNWRHEFRNADGGYYYYGSCTMGGDFSSYCTDANDAWHHHVLVFEPGQTTGTHWKDGVKAGTMSMSGVDSGVVRRLCLGTTVMTESGGKRTQGVCNAGLDELALFNFAFSDSQVAWLNANTPRLPAFDVTSLTRTVSGACAWDGFAAGWTVAGGTRKLVWPAGEDTNLTATVSASADTTLTVDTVVAANVTLTGAANTAVELGVAADCAFKPATLTLADGLVVTLPNGTTVAGDLTLGTDTLVKLDATGRHAGEERAVATGGIVLPSGETDVLSHFEVIGAPGVTAALSADGKTVTLVGLAEDPTRKVVSGAVALDADADWTGYAVVLLADGATLDLAGHDLTLRGFANEGTAEATITDTVGGGQLIVDVPAGETARNDNVKLDGQLKLVKNGAGTYVSYRMNCPYAGGTEINGGTVRFTAPYGYSCPFGTGENRWVRINEGTVFDVDGTQDLSTIFLSLNGGTIVNANMRYSTVLMAQNLPALYTVRLEKDSTIEFAETYGFRGSAGIGPTELDLGGHKLTVRLGGDDRGIFFNNCAISAGEIEVVGGGYLVIGNNGVQAPQVKLTADAAYFIGPNDSATATFADFTALKASAANGYSNGVVKVSGAFAPTGANFPHVELADGGTLDLSARTGTASALSNHTGGNVRNYFTVAEGATSVTVNLAGRADLAALVASASPYVMTWDGAPRADVQFVPDAETKKFYRLKADATGIRIGARVGMYILLK